MTLQFIRKAQLLVGQPGNPGKIGTPAVAGVSAKPAGTTLGPVLYSGDRSAGGAISGVPSGGTLEIREITDTPATPATAAVAAVPNSPATPGDGLDLSQLRFSFSIEHHVIQTPGSMVARVYNVSRETANLVQKEFTRIRLSAGYAGNLGVIFDGTIANVRFGRESQTDTYMEITAQEADQAHNFAVVSTTLAAGSTPNDRLSAVLTALEPYGITAGYIPENLPGGALPRGRVLFGMARDQLRALAAATGCNWSIKNDRLNFIPADAYLPGDAIVLTSRTGMVGLPEQTNQGIVAKCLLNPAVVPGRAIQIDQKSVQAVKIGVGLSDQVQKGLIPSIAGDGFYRTLLVQHEGDTRGSAWHTTATCVALAAPIPAGLVGAPTNAPAEFFEAQRVG